MATDIFETYLKTQASKDTYRYVWNNLVLNALNTTTEKILEMNRKQQEQQVIDYITILKNENKAPTTIGLRLSVMEFVFSMNDVMLNWKKLKKMIPERVKPTGADTWKDQEIRDMIKCAGTVRNMAMIYFFVSVGCRITALTEIKLKDVEDFENCVCIMIYAGTPYEYPSFLTPEATKMLKHYLKTRESRGEKLTPESPLFASESSLSPVKPITRQGITNAFYRIYAKFPNSRVKNGYRYNIQVTHGFRKWQATKLKLKIDVKHSISERLLGHKAGLDSNYFVTNSKEAKLQLFEAFKECIPDLTLDKSQVLEYVEDYKKEIQSLKIQRDALLKSIETVSAGIEKLHEF